MRSFLMIGQSNMAGRGALGEMPPIMNARVRAFMIGTWTQAAEPINRDREAAYESLQLSFGDAVQRSLGGLVGLIPCAEGGTRLPHFQVVNAQLRSLPERRAQIACVAARDLPAKSDQLHFCTQSLRALGRRYAAAWIEKSAALTRAAGKVEK